MNLVGRAFRRYLPSPRLWATLIGVRVPSRSIAGRTTALARPEGVAFTRAGDLMAVSNSGSNSITIYTTKNGAGHSFSDLPTCTIKNSTYLNYVHGVAFSPCGNILAAAARESHSVALFFRADRRSAVFEQEPRCVLSGDGAGINNPAGVSFHPSGEFIAVANRKGDRCITLHRCEQTQDDFRLESTPFQCVSEDDFLKHGLAAPHDVDFSGDGAYMVVCHTRFFKNEYPQGESGLSILVCGDTSPISLDRAPKFTELTGRAPLHSVACNPASPFFAVSNERHSIEVYQWRSEESSVSRIGTISIDRAGDRENPKGVAFTSDGDELIVTTTLNQVLFFRHWADHESARCSGG